MNAFDKLCAIGAFLIGIVFLILGGLGLFAGCSANFTLPPVLGVIPALVGWGIVRPIYLAWNRPSESRPYYEPEPRREVEELDYWQDQRGQRRDWDDREDDRPERFRG